MANFRVAEQRRKAYHFEVCDTKDCKDGERPHRVYDYGLDMNLASIQAEIKLIEAKQPAEATKDAAPTKLSLQGKVV